jgi:hypothetical protein
MVDLTCTLPLPKTPQELDRAIQNYLNSNLSGVDLFCQWQVIRDAALALGASEQESDRIPGESSY